MTSTCSEALYFLSQFNFPSNPFEKKVKRDYPLGRQKEGPFCLKTFIKQSRTKFVAKLVILGTSVHIILLLLVIFSKIVIIIIGEGGSRSNSQPHSRN